MATLTVWKFASADGAAATEATIQSLQKQELIKVYDAAVVSWPQGAKKPKTRQLNNLVGAGALAEGLTVGVGVPQAPTTTAVASPTNARRSQGVIGQRYARGN